MTEREEPPEKTDWSTDLQQDMGKFVFWLAYAVDRSFTREMSAHNLLPLEVYLLTIFQDMGDCTATQLTQLLPIDAARVSRLVNSLVEKGLVRRQRMQTDRRVIMLRLTPGGERLTSEIIPQMMECWARLTAGLSDEETRGLFSGGQRIIDNYREMTDA